MCIRDRHEVLEGEDALAYLDGTNIECKVNCAADAGDLTAKIRFALCLTLEVEQGIGLPIYQEVRERIAPQVQVQPGVP